MHNGMAPGTGISCAQIRGTSPKPACRAAVAGKDEVRSPVAVNRMLMQSSVVNSLRSSSSR